MRSVFAASYSVMRSARHDAADLSISSAAIRARTTSAGALSKDMMHRVSVRAQPSSNSSRYGGRSAEIGITTVSTLRAIQPMGQMVSRCHEHRGWKSPGRSKSTVR